MNVRTIGGFLVGNARAIREVAGNRAALWTGLALVLLTGVARNYDQIHFLETPRWLVGPLVFSLFSGSFLYAILIAGFARRHFAPDRRSEPQWGTFMGLFWMTAPIAWLYAIPVERFLNSFQAAQANVALLAIVSLWRVLLMSRILVVLLEVPFPRALGWVLLAASLEIIVVVFFGAFFSDSFGRSILAGMAGMRNAPEEALLTSALATVWGWSWAVLLACIILLALRRFRGSLTPLPASSPGKVPWIPLAAFAALWTLIAIEPQREQGRFAIHAGLVNDGHYPEALAYLARHEASDFPLGRRIEPNPYEYRVWQHLPPTIARLTPETPPWIRHAYLNHLTATFSHHYTRFDSLTNIAAMVSAIEQLPEGREWLGTNQTDLARQGLGLRYDRSDSWYPAELAARTNILDTLSRMGMTGTNLARMTE